MPALPIRITGDPVLHRVADPVQTFDDELRTLVADMVETMHKAPGVGLAAPQVGVPLRLFVFEWDDGTKHVSGTAANPELWISPVAVGDADEEEESEGCLSIPGERFALHRADRAILRAQDVDGKPFELEAEGWLARILQHEFDHLNGILYVDRLDSEDQRDVAKLVRRNGWGVPGKSWLPGVDHLED
jgi:peptide deformylase